MVRATLAISVRGITVAPEGDDHGVSREQHTEHAEHDTDPIPAAISARASREATSARDRGATQLRLLPGGPARVEWTLDERTRQTGRTGVAQAREILRQARPPQPRDALSEAS
jgi:hypothetical protein